MKLSTNQAIQVPTLTPQQGGRTSIRTIEPDVYYGYINEIDTATFQGRVRIKGDGGGYVEGGKRFDYLKLIPDVVILTDGSPVSSSLESYVVGTLVNDEIVDLSAQVTGDTPKPIWFGESGAGSLMVATGILNDEGFTGVDTKDIKDVVVRVRTSVAAYIPNPVSKNFDFNGLVSELKGVNEGVEPTFADFDHLVLRYNVKNGYTIITDKDWKTIYDDGSDLTEINAERYAELLSAYRDGSVKFVGGGEDEGNSVRLKTKNVITGFFTLSERQVSQHNEEKGTNWYHKDGVTYRSKAAATSTGSAAPVVSGW